MDLPQGDVLMSIELARRSIKVLMNTHSSLKNVERDQKYMDLLKSLHQMEMAYMAMEKENTQIKNELALAKDLIYSGGAHWSKSDESKKEPFCSPCFEHKGQAIHLKQYSIGAWHCPICTDTYRDSSYREPNNNHYYNYDPFADS
jgi:hypothetical protein